ncbi:MAG: protein phosphatase 2C domain-containing protein [Deltaproteobacteria bacterium]|nr:protein phosphatase 2C domain-containing protein [Deltaproteobacteria bacterium]
MAGSREETLSDATGTGSPPPADDDERTQEMAADEAPTEEVEAPPRARRPGPPPAHAQPIIPPPVGPPPSYAGGKQRDSNPRRRRSQVTTPNQPPRESGEIPSQSGEHHAEDQPPDSVSGELSSAVGSRVAGAPPSDEPSIQVSSDMMAPPPAPDPVHGPPLNAPPPAIDPVHGPPLGMAPQVRPTPAAAMPPVGEPAAQIAPDAKTHEAMRPVRQRRSTPKLGVPTVPEGGPPPTSAGAVPPKGGARPTPVPGSITMPAAGAPPPANRTTTPPPIAGVPGPGAPPPAAPHRPSTPTPLSRPATPVPGPSQVFQRTYVGLTDVGAQRDQNEDAFFCDDNADLYLVCDGMGGHASGQVASEMAIRTVVEVMLGGSTPAPGKEPLVAALELANQAILSRASRDPECKGMGTTAVGIRAENDLVHICHIGDSRCYLLRGGRLQQVTEDHSLQNLYKRKPEMAGRLGPAHSNVIVRAIGLEPTIEVDYRTMAMEHGDLFLLCSDGLTDLVADWMIQEIITSDESLEAIAQNLIRAANANGGTDNITVILLGLGLPGADPDGAGGKTLPGF